MSFFTKLLGSSGKGGKAPSTQEAIQKLRETEEMMMKKQDFLEKKIDEEKAAAIKHGTKNKRAALLALKRKRRYMKQLDQIDGTLSTIELQREMLENATANTEVLKNIGYASKAMKAAHKDMDVDKVHDLFDEIADQNEIAQEITDAISTPMGMADDFDEDDLMAELEELGQEEVDKKLLEIRGSEDVPLPNVPTASLPSTSVKKKEEEDLDGMEELASWATS